MKLRTVPYVRGVRKGTFRAGSVLTLGGQHPHSSGLASVQPEWGGLALASSSWNRRPLPWSMPPPLRDDKGRHCIRLQDPVIRSTGSDEGPAGVNVRHALTRLVGPSPPRERPSQAGEMIFDVQGRL